MSTPEYNRQGSDDSPYDPYLELAQAKLDVVELEESAVFWANQVIQYENRIGTMREDMNFLRSARAKRLQAEVAFEERKSDVAKLEACVAEIEAFNNRTRQR